MFTEVLYPDSLCDVKGFNQCGHNLEAYCRINKQYRIFLLQTTNDFHKHSIFAQEFDLNACTTDASRTYMMGKSPFPALDVFIENVASVGNIPGNTLLNKILNVMLPSQCV